MCEGDGSCGMFLRHSLSFSQPGIGGVLVFLNMMMMNKQVKQSVSILSLISGARKGKREATHATRAPRLHLISNCVPPSPAQSTSLNPMQHNWVPYGSTRDSSFLELCGEDPRLSVNGFIGISDSSLLTEASTGELGIVRKRKGLKPLASGPRM